MLWGEKSVSATWLKAARVSFWCWLSTGKGHACCARSLVDYIHMSILSCPSGANFNFYGFFPGEKVHITAGIWKSTDNLWESPFITCVLGFKISQDWHQVLLPIVSHLTSSRKMFVQVSNAHSWSPERQFPFLQGSKPKEQYKFNHCPKAGWLHSVRRKATVLLIRHPRLTLLSALTAVRALLLRDEWGVVWCWQGWRAVHTRQPALPGMHYASKYNCKKTGPLGV